MATLLSRLGRWSARRAGFVIGAWGVLIALTVSLFLAFGGTLATTFSIPGTETDRVTAQMQDELGTSNSIGTVVFHADEPITANEQQLIADALEDVAALEGIEETLDPFVTETERVEQGQEISDGLAEVAAGREELAEGRDQLEDGLAQIEEGLDQLEQGRTQAEQARTDLTTGIEQAQAAGAPAEQVGALRAQLEQVEGQLAGLDAQQAELEAQRAELQAQRDELPGAEQDLDDAEEQLQLGEELMELADGVRTVSADGDVAMGVVMFDGPIFNVSEELKTQVMDTLDAADLGSVDVAYSAEIADSVEGLVGPAEVIGVIVAAIVLLIMFRAIRPAALPILSSLVGVAIGVTGSLALSDVVEMTSVTPILGLMLGLAVGIDYTLFVINRHRRQVRAGMALDESIGLANGTAGSAVLFAGLTVMIALLALNVTGIGFLGLMGTVGAFCVLVAVMVALTFTPALSRLLGRNVLSRRDRRRSAPSDSAEQTPEPMGHLRATLTVVVSVALLLVIALPALSMRLGLPDGSASAQDSTQYQAFSITEDAFGAGQNGILVVTADLPDAVAQDDELRTQLEIARELADQPDVAAVAPSGISDDRDFLAFQVIPVEGPSTESTEDLVHNLRSLSPLDDGTELGIAGLGAGQIDVSDQLADALPLYLTVVVGLSLLILMVVFRSLLVPVLATAGFVLSLFAALGATTAVFQWGWLGGIFDVHTPGPLLNFLPLLLAGVLFGLAMDYQIFVSTGMREAYVHGMPARSAVIAGLRNGRAVVTAAAIIMISVFGGFAFAHLTMVRPIGFALAVGVLFDAFVVRMLLLPAAMHLLGRSAWWLPKWLDAVLPRVDVEGSALQRTRGAEDEPLEDSERTRDRERVSAGPGREAR